MAKKAKKKSPSVIIISVVLVLCIAGGLVFAFRDKISFLNKQDNTSVSDTAEKQISTPLGELKLSGEWAETVETKDTSSGGEFALSFYSKVKSKDVFLFELSVGSQSNGYQLGTYTDGKGKEQSVWLNINEITPDSSWSQDKIDEINKTQSCVNELIDQLNQIDGFKAIKQN